MYTKTVLLRSVGHDDCKWLGFGIALASGNLMLLLKTFQYYHGSVFFHEQHKTIFTFFC